jgi:hypothetical protein
MKRGSASLDELWEELKYAHEIRGATVPAHWMQFWRVVRSILAWKAARS